MTEDADLGLRLARFGYRVEVLGTTTWEEAPPGWRDWVAQRTRWQKGWLQTYFVHMRQPGRLWRELGPASWLWVQVVLGGGMLSALVHPWFYLWLAGHALAGTLGPPPGGGFAGVLWWAALVNLVAAYSAQVVLAALTVRGRGFAGLTWHVLASPLYWLPVSLAAYRAVWQAVRAPHHWEKTPHRARVEREAA